MLTGTDHDLIVLAEELAELGSECLRAHARVCKALRFGLDEVQPGQSLPNRDRIVEELRDVIAMMWVLAQKGVVTYAHVEQKAEKVAKYKALSIELGRVDS